MAGREVGEGIYPLVIPSIQTWVIFLSRQEDVVTMRSLLFDLTDFFCYLFRACRVKARKQKQILLALLSFSVLDQ